MSFISVGVSTSWAVVVQRMNVVDLPVGKQWKSFQLKWKQFISLCKDVPLWYVESRVSGSSQSFQSITPLLSHTEPVFSFYDHQEGHFNIWQSEAGGIIVMCRTPWWGSDVTPPVLWAVSRELFCSPGTKDAVCCVTLWYFRLVRSCSPSCCLCVYISVLSVFLPPQSFSFSHDCSVEPPTPHAHTQS